MAQRRPDVRVAKPGQALARGAAGWDSAEAPLDIAVFGDVQLRHRLDDGPLGVIEMTEGEKMISQGPGLIQRPSLERSHELNLVDQPVLECQKTEEEIAISSDGGHGAASLWADTGYGGSVPGAGGLRPRRAGSVGLSHERSARPSPSRPIEPQARSSAPRLRARASARFAQKAHYRTGEQSSFSVGGFALAYEPRAALRASFRRYPMIFRSIRPTRNVGAWKTIDA
jgi:hypothetical protein